MKKFLKNKKNIFKFTLFFLMLFLFAYLGTRNYKVEVTDNVRFSNEYKDISKNNVFKYAKEQEVLEILNGKSGIIFMGFSTNIWCHYYAEYLNEVTLKNGGDTIYYYDFKKDRSLNNSTYHAIVEKLKDYLLYDDVGNANLSAPLVVVVKNGVILYVDNEVQFIKGRVTPEEYFTDYRKNLLKTNFELAVKTLFNKA